MALQNAKPLINGDDLAILAQNKALPIETLAEKIMREADGKILTAHEIAVKCGFGESRLKIFDALFDGSFDTAKVFMYPNFFAQYILNNDEAAGRLYIRRIIQQYKPNIDYFEVVSLDAINFILVELMGDSVDASLLIKKNTRFGKKSKNYAMIGAQLIDLLQQSSTPIGLFIRDTLYWVRRIYTLQNNYTNKSSKTDA